LINLFDDTAVHLQPAVLDYFPPRLVMQER
jgi:hypothetical protein